MMLVSAKLTADEKEMVEALRRARAEMEKVRGTTRTAGQSAREAATGTGQLARAQRDGAEASARARRETERSTTAQGRATQAGDRLARSQARTRTETLRATAATQAFSGAMTNAAASAALINGPLGGVASRFSTIASLTGRMNIAAVGAIVGLSGLTLAAARGISTFTDYERQQLTLQGALNATGFAAGRTADQINATARRIAVDTLASEGEVRRAATVLLTFRSIAGETFDRTLELSQDLAASGFGTLEGNAVQLGKALEDPITGLSALTRVGVSFSTTQKEMIRDFAETGRVAEAQRLILEAIAQQVGGTGVAAGGGLAGGFDLLGVNVNRFFEIIGQRLNDGSRLSEFLLLVGRGVGTLNDLLDETPAGGAGGRDVVAEQARLLALEERRAEVARRLAEETARPGGEFSLLAATLTADLDRLDAEIAALDTRVAGLIDTSRDAADEAAEAARKSADEQKKIAEERIAGVIAETEREIEAARLSELANAQRAAQLKAGVAADSEAGQAIAAKVAELFAEREATESARQATEERTRAEARARETVEELLESLRGELDVMRTSDPVLREMIRLRGNLTAATDQERAAVENLISVKRVEAALGNSQTELDRLRERVAAARDRAQAEAAFGKGAARGAERDAFLLAAAEERRLRSAGLDGPELAAQVARIRAEALAALQDAPDAFFSSGRGGKVKKEVDILAKAFEEFGQRFGGTLEFQQRQIEAWRVKTIEQLRAAGFGHQQYADMVDAIARDRLKDAYAEDLQNRDDWQAGVERGLNEVFGAQLSMADIAEDTVKAAFSGMEDAFVSLAKTGKIETADLVDFALRQFFRLAAAAATGNLGSAGGGIFGNLLSSIFGGGSTTQLSTRLAGFPSVTNSSGSIVLPQFHDGGAVRDGGTLRRVPLALFDGAPRLHRGGLLPGEVPAILEEDERVLTLAQQQSTAATIQGLAQLAAAPRGAPAGSPQPPVINLNVIGAPGEPQITARQNGDALDIDLIFNDIEGRLARNTAQGRGLAPAIAGRFNLRGGI
ncbi:phage tail tape measure protein, lambda family [Roseovarius azorensis]|uniref:Phage tail tape measure protein, lambda family n=1 Tax=Roseovarius azorensis TaxID=1287727 RepID=A0A1H7G9J2_9RHOB|nr:phage tail tape measure C-terminal domain-containing protein [Roseovarius azorensis]SEK34724.1 phage tail tape measure protein, lambda family [Roseovarius azorensis]